MDKIVLIDGNSIVNRAYFGLPDLTNSKGMHTNAVLGFLNIMTRLLDDEKPEYLAIAFDVHEPTFRHLKYDGYKAGRKPMDEALRVQFPVLRELLKSMGVFIIEKGGYEADDLLGTMAKKAEKLGLSVSVVSGDKDLIQLASDSIKVRMPVSIKGKTSIKDYNTEEFKEDFGLDNPLQIIDLKAVMGDSSDNYKGVDGVGKVHATRLVKEYNSVEGIYENIDKISGALHDKLIKGKDDAFFCKWLATIKTDCDIDFELSYAKLGNIYTKEAYSIIKELEIKSYYNRFENAEEILEEAKVSAANDNLNNNMLHIITDMAEAFETFEKLSNENDNFVGMSYAAFLRNDGFSHEIIGLSLECGNTNAVFVTEGFLTEEMLIDETAKLMKKKKILAGFNLKDISDKLDINTDKLFDMKIAAYLLYAGKNNYTEADIAKSILDLNVPEISEILGKQTLAEAFLEADFTGESREKGASLISLYAHVAAMAASEMNAVLIKEGLSNLFYDVEMPLMRALKDMEKAGITVNREALSDYGRILGTNIKELEKTIFNKCGEEFNINSPKQLGEILFDKLKLPGGKKTKSGYSTSAEELEKLKSEDPVIELILRYRELTKLKSTYAEGLGAYICRDGRIHTSFNQTVTATGRLSSTNPNLQNIPIRREAGREIRKMFVPADGYCFIDADYSQIELRILAHMSGDESLIYAYNNGDDIHRITASKVFNIPYEEVTPQMRSNAKAVNFGIIYGMSAHGLGQEINIPNKEAEKYINQYFETYPTIKKYLDSLVNEARSTGYVRTLYGRKRYVQDINASNHMVRKGAERIAMNSPIQGTAADIMKMALVNVYERLKKEKMKSRILLQVHDELLLEVPYDEKDMTMAIVKEEMMKAAALKVKLEVSVESGDNWDEAH